MDTALTNQRATIIGMAREGTALARFLANKGARVTISAGNARTVTKKPRKTSTRTRPPGKSTM